jgi:hypothetical protein
LKGFETIELEALTDEREYIEVGIKDADADDWLIDELEAEVEVEVMVEVEEADDFFEYLN